MQLSVFLCTFASALSLLFAAQAQAQVPIYDEVSRSFKRQRWEFDFQTTYYQATANYSKEGGEYNDLPSGHSYNLLDFDFGARWVPVSRWGLSISSRVSNAESKDLTHTRKNSSLTQVVLGTDYLLFGNRIWNLYPDFSLTIPLARIDANADEVLNREGALEATAKIVGRTRWKILYPYAFIGFTYRDEDRASLMPYAVGTELQFSGFNIGGEVRGYQTVSKDKYSDDPLKRQVVASKNGGALRYYSVDPSLLESNLWLRTSLFESWELKLGGGTSLSGASTSAGWNVFAALNYVIGQSAPQIQSRPQELPENSDQFIEEISDGVDQNLFKLPPTPPPSPQEQRKKLQKDLDQTEFHIELKRPGKKRKR